MNAERLLRYYERIADAPDAVARLRRFILDLAVRGKLVPQDANDEPASELLKRIAKEKARLVKAGNIRDRTSLPAVANAAMPFPLPSSWEWVRFGNIVDFSAGRTPARNDTSFWNNGDHPWVSIADMEDGQVLTTTKETVTDKARERVFGSGPETPGTILMSFKLTIGKIARLGISAFHNEAIISVRLHFRELDAYLFKTLPQFARQGETKGAIKGATLNRDSISNILLPLPPLAEQHRIVVKVDELMTLCDRLQAARTKREATRDRLAAASLACLDATDSATFHDDARFALDALPALTARPDQIKQLRRTILNLAVRGKLVPHDPSDEPAAHLLRRIAKEKSELAGSHAIRHQAASQIPNEVDLPFDLPSGWLWANVGSVTLFTQYGTSQRADAASAGVPVLTMANVQDGLVVRGNEKRIPEQSEELPDLYVQKYDILYNRTNSAELVGKAGIYLGANDKCTFASYLIRIRSSTTHGNALYLNLAMNAPYFRATQIHPHIKKQTGQANVNGTALRNMLVPVPPLAEQRRIVTKTHELMALCDHLEASLVAGRGALSRLLEAVLQEALLAAKPSGAQEAA